MQTDHIQRLLMTLIKSCINAFPCNGNYRAFKPTVASVNGLFAREIVEEDM